MKARIFSSVFVATTIATAPAMALTEQEREDVRSLIESHLHENPDIVRSIVSGDESVKSQASEKSVDEPSLAVKDEVSQRNGGTETLAEKVYREGDPVMGNPEGDVTVVEWFDYNCPYCRKAQDEVAALIERDPNVRVVYKEYPILADSSVLAAAVALAAYQQGDFLYDLVHASYMDLSASTDRDTVLRLAREAGVDIESAKEFVTSGKATELLKANSRIGKEYDVTQTPTFFIGDRRVVGVKSASELQEIVDRQREKSEGSN